MTGNFSRAGSGFAKIHLPGHSPKLGPGRLPETHINCNKGYRNRNRTEMETKKGRGEIEDESWLETKARRSVKEHRPFRPFPGEMTGSTSLARWAEPKLPGCWIPRRLGPCQRETDQTRADFQDLREQVGDLDPGS